MLDIINAKQERIAMFYDREKREVLRQRDPIFNHSPTKIPNMGSPDASPMKANDTPLGKKREKLGEKKK